MTPVSCWEHWSWTRGIESIEQSIPGSCRCKSSRRGASVSIFEVLRLAVPERRWGYWAMDPGTATGECPTIGRSEARGIRETGPMTVTSVQGRARGALQA